MEQQAPVQMLAMGCDDETCSFRAMQLQRRPVGDYDVLIDMKYCGVCHSDVHIAANHLKAISDVIYPIVPGHELSGVVEAVGSKVTKFKIGDKIGVGCMVDSCMECASCKVGREHQCKKQLGGIGTYGAQDKFGRAAQYPATRPDPKDPNKTIKTPTIGGYSTKMVVYEHFGIRIPPDFPLECAGPIMCSGITMYDPLKMYAAGPGKTVGVAGLGGLGVMGIKLAKAMGATVMGISRNQNKKELSLSAGAAGHISVSDSKQLSEGAGTMDFILDTIPTKHDLSIYTKLLKPGGKVIVLGLCPEMITAHISDAILGGRSNAGASLIGSVANTEEAIALCDKADPKILPEIEVRPVTDLTEIYQKLIDSNESGKQPQGGSSPERYASRSKNSCPEGR